MKNVLLIMLLLLLWNEKKALGISLRHGEKESLMALLSDDDHSKCADGNLPIPTYTSTDTYWSGTAPYCNGKCSDCTDNGYLCAGEYGNPDFAKAYAAKMYDVNIPSIPDFGSTCASGAQARKVCEGCTFKKALCYKVTSEDKENAKPCIFKKTNSEYYVGTAPACGASCDDCGDGYDCVGTFGGPLGYDKSDAQNLGKWLKNVYIENVPSFGADCGGLSYDGKALCYKVPGCTNTGSSCEGDTHNPTSGIDCCDGYTCTEGWVPTSPYYLKRVCFEDIRTDLVGAKNGCAPDSVPEQMACFFKNPIGNKYWADKGTIGTVLNSETGEYELDKESLQRKLMSIKGMQGSTVAWPTEPCTKYYSGQSFTLCALI